MPNQRHNSTADAVEALSVAAGSRKLADLRGYPSGNNGIDFHGAICDTFGVEAAPAAPHRRPQRVCSPSAPQFNFKTMKKSNNNDLAEELTPIRGSFEPNAVIGFWTDITGRSRGFATREEALAFIETRRPAASGGPAESYLVNPAVAMSCHMAHASAQPMRLPHASEVRGDFDRSDD